MGKYDGAMYEYLADNERFADLFNAVFFGGEQVLKSGLLEQCPERHVETLSWGSASKDSKGKAASPPVKKSYYRDVRKRVGTGETFVVMSVENQADIDYTMPWQIMQYDQMVYGEQIRDIRRQKEAVLQKQRKPLSDWTTRLGPEDRLYPVYTICFYHGTEPWNGPRSLKDMMRFEGIPGADVWQERFHDYGMTLFCAGEAGDLSRFGTELRQLLEVLAARKDKKGLAELWNREDFSRLSRETAEIMAIMTDSVEILEKLDQYETEEGYDMCLAMDELRQDWKAEGENRIQELIKRMLMGGDQDQLHRLSEKDFLEQMYLKYSI